MGRPDGKRPPGRPGCRWVDNIKTNFQEVGWRDLDWFDLHKGRNRRQAFVNAVMNLRVP